MKNTAKISLTLAGIMLLQSIGGGLAYADGPSGTVTYNGQDIQVNNGQFTLNGVTGSIDADGMVIYNGQAAKLTEILGVTGYQVQGRAAVPVTVTSPVHKGPTGTITYSGQSIIVINGQFTLGGKLGTINDNGVVVYDGQTKNLKEIPGVTGYQVQGQAYVPVIYSASGGLTREWLENHGGISKDPVWNDYTGLANDAQVAMWLKENPGLTPAQIVDAMQNYGIGLNQLVRAMRVNNPTSTIGAQDLIRMANDAGITRENLAQKGIIGPMSFAETRNNIWWAVQAGTMNKGVMCAAFVIDQGRTNPECREYSQADMDLALSYQKNGYWGPGGSGDPYTELTKAGMITNGLYTGPNNWGNGTTRQSTGPNIAGTNYSTNYTPVAHAGTLPTYTSTANKLSCTDYPNICNGDLTIGTRIGDTLTLTNKQIKDYFATNPTPEDIIKFAAEKKITASQLAQAIAIARGDFYDPTAILNYVRDYPGYALGPDNIIVKLQPGQTKRASDGMLEGTWSSDPGHVSYTDWARAWYCAGNGDVNGGKVDYGHGATTQQCDSSSTTSTVATGSTSSSSNPYASSFSAANISTLNTWIATKVTAKQSTMTTAAYASFLNTLNAKITTVKSSTTNQMKLNVLNYLQYEITK